MSEERIAALEAEVEALREEMRLAAQLIGHTVRNVVREAGLNAMDFGPDTSDAPDGAVAQFYDALAGRPAS